MRAAIDPRVHIEGLLREVPAGSLEKIRTDDRAEAETASLGEIDAVTLGRGRLSLRAVYPGVEVTHVALLASEIKFRHAADSGVLSLFHCRSGRIGWTMHDGDSVYLGPGDLTIHRADRCSHSSMQLPLGFVEGISVLIDFDTLLDACPRLLHGFDVDIALLRTSFLGMEPFPVALCETSECIFSPLYTLPPERKDAWLRLKIQELLLWLIDLTPASNSFPRYPSYQAEIIRAVRDELTAHPEQRVTVDELSRRHFINSSTLKAVFKEVYGLPIAAYMRDYRIRMAARLLRTTDDTVAEIATRVGYGAQGKFSLAFREVYHMLPTKYREAHRQTEQSWRPEAT